jgi:hypothetical protein
MLKHSTQFLPLLFCLAITNSYAQLHKASDYFPLNVGNVWEYQQYLGFSKPQRFEIISDTLIADTVHVYRTLLRIIDIGNPTPQEGYVYYHYNSDSTVVYRDYELPLTPYSGFPMIDTRRGVGAIWTYPAGDILEAFAITDTGSVFYFDRIRAWAKVQSGFFIHPDSVVFYENFWRFVTDIGAVRKGDDTLLYAKVNGVEYGTSVSVKQRNESSNIPREPSLRVYPNPIQDNAVIEIETFYLQQVEIGVFNLLGQRVHLLYSGSLPNGRHFLIWNGDDSNGKNLNKGVYFLVLRSQRIVKTLKILYL